LIKTKIIFIAPVYILDTCGALILDLKFYFLPLTLVALILVVVEANHALLAQYYYLYVCLLIPFTETRFCYFERGITH